LILDYIQEKPELVVVNLLASLKHFVNFVKDTYLKQRPMRQYSIDYFIHLLQKEETKLKLELLKIIQHNSFPNKGMFLFIIAAHFYVLLIQEILSLKDLPDCQESKSFISEVTHLLKSCAEFVLRSFNAHWKARLEGISYVSISKKILVEEKKKQEIFQQFELSGIIIDSYRLSKDPISLCQIECSEELMETETHKLLMFANSLRDDYIIKRYADLQNNMYFPVESAAVWMKAAVKLANLSTTERKVCLTVLHRHDLNALEPDGEAVFTLQPQIVPVAFHSEEYFSPEVLFEIDSSMDGLQGYLKTLSETSYLCARCLASREHGEKVTLVEVACLPEYMVNLLYQNKSKFTKKSFRANVDSK